MLTLLIVSYLLTQAPSQPAQAAPSAEDILKKLDESKDLKDREKSFEVAASLGKLYYAHGRFGEAITFFEQAIEKAQPAKELFVEMKKKTGGKALPVAAAVGCAPKGEVALDEQLKLAQAKAKADPAAAAACLRPGLQGLIEVEAQLGYAKFVTADTAGALAVFDRALQLFEANPDARYGRAAVLIDVKGDDVAALKSAQGDLKLLLKDYPTSAHAPAAKRLLERATAAIGAGGMSKLAAQNAAKPVAAAASEPDRPAPLSQSAIDAVNSFEHTKETDQAFASLVAEGEEHLAKGRYQEALEVYKRVVPFQPDNGRARAGMAWSLVGLGKPMAANVWQVAAQDPAAIDALGDALKAKGDGAGAKALWQRLAQTVPGYAPKLTAKLQ